jgi:hypothetical protein
MRFAHAMQCTDQVYELNSARISQQQHVLLTLVACIPVLSLD